MDRLTITRPDDWHCHLRDGETLAAVLPFTARQFGRAIVMPNLKPPITTVEAAWAYYERIRTAAMERGSDFGPLMTLYLTDATTVEEVRKAHKNALVHAFKLYPAGATTNSADGITAIEKAYDAIAEMEVLGLPLLVHAEVTDPKVDIFDREKVFVDTILGPLLMRYPRLKVVMEHVTTRDGVEFVKSAGPNVAATITAHHLLFNRNAIFNGGLRPHWYCLPVLKREEDRAALLRAATSGNPQFFLGTDTAPHAASAKESSCGCAGCFTAPAALELYAMAFERADALNRLEGFASFHGADFYGLPRNTGTVTLEKRPSTVPSLVECANGDIKPFLAGETIGWTFVG